MWKQKHLIFFILKIYPTVQIFFFVSSNYNLKLYQNVDALVSSQNSFLEGFFKIDFYIIKKRSHMKLERPLSFMCWQWTTSLGAEENLCQISGDAIHFRIVIIFSNILKWILRELETNSFSSRMQLGEKTDTAQSS